MEQMSIHFTTDSLLTCFVEVLAQLRPDPGTVASLRAMDEPLPDLGIAIDQILAPKCASIVVTRKDALVDLVHAESRTEFEARSSRRKRVKVGDFLTSDSRVSRRAAGVVYDRGESGISAPSAEALAIDSKSAATTYNVFETEIGSNKTRIVLVPHVVRPALEQRIDLASARHFLGV